MPEFPKNPDGSNNWDSFFGKEKKKEWTYETLREDVLGKGIKSSSDYVRDSSNNGWPATLTLTSMPNFPKNSDGSNNWDAFFGREKWTYESLREDVLGKGIKSSLDYDRNSSINGWPAKETLTSMADFPKNPDGSNNWDAFFGREKKKEWTYESLRRDVIEKGIKSSSDYRKNSQNNSWPNFQTLVSMPEFPKNPDGSNNWDAFFGKK